MDMKVVEEELRKGWEATSQLRSLLLFPPQLACCNESSKRDNEKILPFLETHYTTIINSFNTSISIIKQYKQSSKHAICQKSNDGLKSRSRTIETSNLEPDGYAWRKYGEKPILNAKHPREYYRCGYRDDQNCQATKHVQKISGSPTKYRIIYYGHHTCHPLLHNNNVPQIHVSDSSEIDFNNIIRFESNNNPTQNPKQEHLSKPFALISPSFSNKSSTELLTHISECPILCTTSNNPPPNFVDTLKILSPLEANNVGCVNVQQPTDKVYSPMIPMNPNDMASSYVDEEGYGVLSAGYGALQVQDIPFSEMEYAWE